MWCRQVLFSAQGRARYVHTLAKVVLGSRARAAFSPNMSGLGCEDFPQNSGVSALGEQKTAGLEQGVYSGDLKVVASGTGMQACECARRMHAFQVRHLQQAGQGEAHSDLIGLVELCRALEALRLLGCVLLLDVLHHLYMCTAAVNVDAYDLPAILEWNSSSCTCMSGRNDSSYKETNWAEQQAWPELWRYGAALL